MGVKSSDTEFARLRHRMVEAQLVARGVANVEVLAAMEKVPRHLFVPPSQQHCAYEDAPLPIGHGQTISQPYMVAKMTELLCPTHTCRILEIGCGSGYQAAVLCELAAEVWTIERLPELARGAELLLHGLGYHNVHVVVGDGTLGFPEAAPYDAIVVAAAAPRVPDALRAQLKPGGRMVIPVTAGYSQDLRLVERLPDAASSVRGEGSKPGDGSGEPPEACFREVSILGCVFVPLIGEDGYSG